MSVRRLIVYLLLNAVVSATATYSVLWFWDRTHPSLPVRQVASVTATPESTAAARPAPVNTQPPAPPTPTPTIYIVRGGDTLGSIARQYGVSVEEIMAANGLTNPNVLQVGQSLVIPVEGYVPPTTEPAALATEAVEPPRPTATRDPNVALPRLVIREVRAPGNLAAESLVIVNEGGPVELDGWSLRDETGRSYVFPALMLFEDGAINLHTAAGTDTVTDLYWGQGTAVWGPGKSVLLSDASGNLHARYTVP